MPGRKTKEGEKSDTVVFHFKEGSMIIRMNPERNLQAHSGESLSRPRLY